MTQNPCRGDLPSVVRNDAQLYEGDLRHYFNVLFYKASNVRFPYHNFRHMAHVLWLCYQACCFYQKELTRRQMRNLLIGAIFHDFDHTGRAGIDDVNITLALMGLDRHLLDEDREFKADIEAVIRPTRFPYTIDSSELDLSGLILRDADVSQALSVAWIQQVIFGLSAEFGKTPGEVLAMQEPFLSQISFHTEWAKQRFPDTDIQAKVQEARELVAILDAKFNTLV